MRDGLLELAHPLHCDIRRRVFLDDLILRADLAGNAAADSAGPGGQGADGRSGVEPAEACEATGNGFSLDIVPDPQALLGYRLRRIGAGHFATVMLATMEATAQVAGPKAIVVNDLNALSSAATDRIDHRTRPFSRAGAGAAP